MKNETIPAAALFKEWRKKPEYAEAYGTLECEYTLHEVMIRARMEAGLTQKELAARMGTSEAAVSRLLGADGGHAPSWKTIAKFAMALGKKPILKFVDA